MASPDLQVDQLLRRLLAPGSQGELAGYRLTGSGNPVYRIPVDDHGSFVIVKLLPSPRVEWKSKLKRTLSNLFYGERVPTASTGRGRALDEIERTREWMQAGLPVPPLVEVSLPDVRVFRGLPHPTLYAILNDEGLALERKLRAVACVSRALGQQHALALSSGKPNLVHRDAGPSNTLFDLESEQTWWFDLEQPASIPGMALEEVVTRSFRLFLHRTLDYLADDLDSAVRAVVPNYGQEAVVRRYLEHMERQQRTLVYHLTRRLSRRLTVRLLDRGLLERVRSCLQEAPAADVPSSIGGVPRADRP